MYYFSFIENKYREFIKKLIDVININNSLQVRDFFVGYNDIDFYVNISEISIYSNSFVIDVYIEYKNKKYPLYFKTNFQQKITDIDILPYNAVKTLILYSDKIINSLIKEMNKNE